MTEKRKKSLSPAMKSALQAVARMKGDSAIDWVALLAESELDDRGVPDAETHPQRGWKPAGR